MYQGNGFEGDSFESAQIDITALFMQDVARLPIVGGRSDYLPLARRVERGQQLKELIADEMATTIFRLREQLSATLDRLTYLSSAEATVQFVSASAEEFEEFLDNPQLVAPPCVTRLAESASSKRKAELETTAWRGFYLLGLLPSTMRNTWSETTDTDEIATHFETVLNEYDASKSALIEGTARYVLRIALGYVHSGIPYLDLVQEGYIGLIRAIDKFREAKGGHFQSYAAYWIKQRIRRYIADHSRLIRVPVHFHEEVRQVERTRRALESETGSPPTDLQLFVALEWLTDADVVILERYQAKQRRQRLLERFHSCQQYFDYLEQPISAVPQHAQAAVKALAKAQTEYSKNDLVQDKLSVLVNAGWFSKEEADLLRAPIESFPANSEAAGALSRLKRARARLRKHRIASAKHYSLDYDFDSDSESESAFIEDYLVSPLSTETLGDREALRGTIREAMSLLTERETEVLLLRFGICDGEEKTLEEVGKRLRVTRERIRQIEARALGKLRRPHRAALLIDFLEADPRLHESIAGSLHLRLLQALNDVETTSASSSGNIAEERAHIEALLEKYIMQGRKRASSRTPYASRAKRVKEVLQQANEPLHYSEIHNRIMRELPPEHHYPKERTYATLFYSDLFEAYGRGVFGLAEWSRVSALASDNRPLSHCPAPLLPEEPSTTAFFDSVILGRHLLEHNACTAEAFWAELQAWAQRNDTNHRDAQSAFDAWYAVGLVDRIDYLSERSAPLTLTFPSGLSLDDMRRYCLTSLCQRVAKMPELLLALIRIPRPTKPLLQKVLFGSEVAGWDVPTRLLMLASFGAVQQVGDEWRITPLGRAILDACPAQDLPDFGEIEVLDREREQEAELEADYADLGLLEF